MRVIGSIGALVVSLVAACGVGAQTQGNPPPLPGGWKAHAMDRPRPEVVAPTELTLRAPPPPNAVVLFDGRNLAQWASGNGEAAPWRVGDGYFEIVPGSGDIRTRESFGDVQLHIEWASPSPPEGSGQDRGNSGVFLMGRYEVQVLDSHQSETYADGQAAAIYGQFPPRANATKAPGEWQTYDIFFRRPRFDSDGSLREPARLTVLHNGVLVQNNEALLGPTAWLKYLPYEAHADALPIELQDHGSPVRFRNVWAVRVAERPGADPGYAARDRVVELPAAELDRLAGIYQRPGGQPPITITREGNRLMADFYWRPGNLDLLAVSPTEFVLRDTDGRVVFEVDRRGNPTGLVFHLGGARMPARRAPR